MNIRKATIDDLQIVASIEAKCFPPAEAASREAFKERLHYYSDHFLIIFDEDRAIGFIDGFVSNETDLTDIMYEQANLHNPNGAWQMIFGLNTIPSERNKGIAGKLIESFIELAKEENRKGLVLTCKDHLVHYYAKFGFVNEGLSISEHGGASWYQMRLTF